MNKRAIAILGAIFILIVGTLGFLIYKKSSSNKTASNNSNNAQVVETPPAEPPTPAQPASAAVRLTDAGDPVLSPILFYQGNGISYFNPNGQLFQTDLQVNDGTAVLSNKKELSIALKSNLARILWPLAGNNFMAEFVSTGKPTWSVYQTSKAAYTDIPTQVYSLDWMPSGDKIMFVWVDGNGKATLNIGNPDTSGYQTLTDLYDPDNVISVAPDGQHVAFYRTQTIDQSKNVINIVTADGKTFAAVAKDGYNTGVLWSPDSKKFLFNKRDASTQKMGLWVADITTGEVRNINVFTTVNKATWGPDGFTIFAGVPSTGVAGQGLTQDTLTKVNYSTGETKQFDPGLAVDAQNLFLSKDGSVLFFKNAQDNSLYYIPVNK